MANTPDRRVVAGVILAAGSASRMGTMKVLLPWRGQPLVRHLAQVALASRLERLVAVTGHDAAEVAAALHDLPVQVVHNAHYRDGLSGSLRLGIEVLGADVAAALVMLGDQPLLTAQVIDQLIARYEQGDATIVAPFADGQRGNPVLFDRTHFAALQAITGDQGARDVLRAHRESVVGVEVEPGVLEDIDTPEAYEALLNRYAE